MLRTITTVVAATAGTLLLLVPMASAHVTAQPPEQTGGKFSVITLRVPNERDEPTTKLEVQLPESLDAVSVKPVPGWEYETTKAELDEPREIHGEQVDEYVSKIVWTGGEVQAGEYQEFYVSARLPEKGEFGDYLLFPALQTYEGGEVVRWIGKPEDEEGSWDDVEEPAPHLMLKAAEGGGHGASAGATSHGDDDDSAKSDTPGVGNDDDLASEDDLATVRIMAAIGLILGALALILALLGVRGRGKERKRS